MSDNYELVKNINEEHKVYLVKNIQDGSFYVKKVLSIYNREVYEYICSHSFKGIPFIKEFWEENGKLVVIEEYISGQNIESMLDKGLVFSDQEAKAITRKLCAILKQFVSGDAFVHRDIKPSNLILKENGDLFLIDFNAAKFVDPNKNRDTVLLGTQGYAAPEQYGFYTSNVQTDIYAIGVLMKELVSGSNVLSDPYESNLKPIINKCTKFNPSDRYQDYEELLKDLNKKTVKEGNEYLPVGFRKKNLLSMIAASIWYLFIVAIGSGMKVENVDGPLLVFDRIGFIASMIATTFFAGNYLGIQEKIGIRKSWNPFTRIIVVTLLSMLIFVSSVILTLLIESIITSIIKR